MNKLVIGGAVVLLMVLVAVWYFVFQSTSNMEVIETGDTPATQKPSAADKSTTPVERRNTFNAENESSDATAQDTVEVNAQGETNTEIETDYSPQSETAPSGEEMDPELIPDLSVS